MNPITVAIKRVAYKFGFSISRIPRDTGTEIAREYEPVYPAATYSPWKTDVSFQEVLASIEGHTMVDRYRCFELWKLIEQSAKLEAGSIIEVGVWRGGTGALMARQAKNHGIGDRVYLCDTFTGVVKTSEKDSAYRGGEHADTSVKTVEKLIDRMRLDNVEILEGIFPDQTGHRVENVRFRFCHVDVDVYESAKGVVNWIWNRMVPGGIMVYDDYGFQGCDGITRYVEEQMALNDRIVVHNLNGHAIILKRQ